MADPTVPLWVGGRMDRLVVGGEHYPGAYTRAKVGQDIATELVAEPWNEYDENAVAVYANGIHAGYIARSTAAQYQPLVRWANSLGWRVLNVSTVEAIPDTVIRPQGERNSFAVTFSPVDGHTVALKINGRVLATVDGTKGLNQAMKDGIAVASMQLIHYDDGGILARLLYG